MAFDNFGRSNPGQASRSPFIRGCDEVTWLALTPEKERYDWLRYDWNRRRETDPNGRLQMPGSRALTPGKSGGPRWFWANARSEACPDRFDTEETIRELWGTLRTQSKEPR